MTGTILNAAAILAGGIISLTTRQQLAEAHQRNLKVILSVLVVYAGLSMTWKGLHGSVWHQLKQLTIVIVAMMLGKFAGQKLRLQPALNRLGQLAQEKFVRAQPGDSDRIGEGFITCTLLFCAHPMAILGALCDGLFGDYRTLALKSVIEGFATFAFAKA